MLTGKMKSSGIFCMKESHPCLDGITNNNKNHASSLKYCVRENGEVYYKKKTTFNLAHFWIEQ